MPPSPDNPTPPPQELSEKRKRIDLVLKVLAEKPLAQNAEEANAQFEDAVKEGEQGIPNIMDQLHVYPLSYIPKIQHSGKTIHFYNYLRHVLFISENGGIEVRIRSGTAFGKYTLEKDPEFLSKYMKPIFSKPGADGHNVWD